MQSCVEANNNSVDVGQGFTALTILKRLQFFKCIFDMTNRLDN